VCSLLLGALAGCGGQGNSTVTPPTIGQIYVTKGTGNPIVHFRAGDNGDVTPQQEIGLANSLARPGTVCIDVPNNRLAGSSFDGIPLLVLVDNASSFRGARFISGAATTLQDSGSCALDGTADLLYVANPGSVAGGSVILVFGPASTASGNIAPLHTILLPYRSLGIVVDPVNNRLFVADTTDNVINIYDSASTLNGAVTPSRTISGPATQLSSIQFLAFESSGHLAASVASGSTVLIFNNAGSISGNVAPSASFVPAAGVVQMAISPAGDLYVTTLDPEIKVFTNVFTASGPINPTRIITGPHTDLDSPLRGIPPLVGGIAVDPTR
jgi:hypothetical protein